MLSIIMLSVAFYYHAERHYAEYRGAGSVSWTV
jgi:hypothetical protein